MQYKTLNAYDIFPILYVKLYIGKSLSCLRFYIFAMAKQPVIKFFR